MTSLIAPVMLVVASLFLFWLASDLNTTLAIPHITTGTILLGVVVLFWAIAKAWSLATDTFKGS